MLLEENFFESEGQLFSVLRDAGFSPKSIADIGASNGEWTEACLKWFPGAEYYLYEPLYSHLDHYKHGLDALAAGNKNVHVRAVGLSDKAGETEFYLTPNSAGSSLLPLPPKRARKVHIRTTTLDDEFCATDSVLDVLKIDTQGGELLILQGARGVLSRASLVLAECWLYPGYGPPTPLAHQVIEELARSKFSAIGMGSPYFDERNVLCALDIYFARSNVLDLIGSHPMSRSRDSRHVPAG